MGKWDSKQNKKWDTACTKFKRHCIRRIGCHIDRYGPPFYTLFFFLLHFRPPPIFPISISLSSIFFPLSFLLVVLSVLFLGTTLQFLALNFYSFIFIFYLLLFDSSLSNSSSSDVIPSTIVVAVKLKIHAVARS